MPEFCEQLAAPGEVVENLDAPPIIAPKQATVLLSGQASVENFDAPPALASPRSQAAEIHLARVKSSLRLFQANFLVAMLAGFWGRKADGHPGPDLLGRGLVILHQLVLWKRIKKEGAPKAPHPHQPRGKPG